MNYQRSLLIDESPLQVIPALAKAIGLNEAIMLQQIHYWQRISNNEKDGVRYAVFSATEMAEKFCFWSEPTIKRTIASLKDQGLLMITKKAGNSWERVNWYAVDYAALNRLNASAPASYQNDPMHRINLTRSIGSKRSDPSDQSDPMINKEKNLNTREGLAKGAKGSPSATALAFKAYAHGIQERYGAAYPPSAKANGQLANVVARVGADNALALVQYYLACPNQFYPKTRHSLDYLVRDCERLFIDMQAAAGKPPPDENGNPPKPAWAEVVLIDAAEKEVFHSTGKTGDPDRIAGYCTQKFASEIRRKKATHLVVRQGGEEKRYSIAELMNHQGNA